MVEYGGDAECGIDGGAVPGTSAYWGNPTVKLGIVIGSDEAAVCEHNLKLIPESKPRACVWFTQGTISCESQK